MITVHVVISFSTFYVNFFLTKFYRPVKWELSRNIKMAHILLCIYIAMYYKCRLVNGFIQKLRKNNPKNISIILCLKFQRDTIFTFSFNKRRHIVIKARCHLPNNGKSF